MVKVEDQRVPLGAFLSAEEKLSLSKVFGTALRKARHSAWFCRFRHWRSDQTRSNTRLKGIPMRFACLVYIDPAVAFDGQPRQHRRPRSGRSRSAAPDGQGDCRRSPDAAIRGRHPPVRERKLARTDGPFMETKEVLAASC